MKALIEQPLLHQEHSHPKCPITSRSISVVMDKDSHVVIIGAGVFGLTTAYQLASEGYKNITVLDRHMPPVCSVMHRECYIS